MILLATPQEWANFLIKLGLKANKKYVMDRIETHRMSGDEIWNFFIEPYSLIKEAANANRLYNADDVDWYFREVSYVNMRGTFPRKSHGRSLAVPRLITVEEIKAQKEKQKKTTETELVEIIIPDNLIGRRITHNSFGAGEIIEQTDNGNMVVNFNSTGNKLLNYQTCISKGFITFD